MAEKHNADQVKIESGRLKTELAGASEIATEIDCQKLETQPRRKPPKDAHRSFEPKTKGKGTAALQNNQLTSLEREGITLTLIHQMKRMHICHWPNLTVDTEEAWGCSGAT